MISEYKKQTSDCEEEAEKFMETQAQKKLIFDEEETE